MRLRGKLSWCCAMAPAAEGVMVISNLVFRGGGWRRQHFFTCSDLKLQNTRPVVFTHRSAVRIDSIRRGFSASASLSRYELGKGDYFSSEGKRLYFDTHALVCLLESKGFNTRQSEVIESATMRIINSNMEGAYNDMMIKVQQEITLQQLMSHIAGVKKDMIILEKSEFSALRTQNEKVNMELQLLKKQLIDEIVKVRAENKLSFNLEKSRIKEMYAESERKLLQMRTEIIELHAQQDRGLTQTKRKIDTEVAGLKTMLESHKLDTIKYLAGSVFTCLTIVLGFYRIWM